MGLYAYLGIFLDITQEVTNFQMIPNKVSFITLKVSFLSVIQ